MNRLLSVFAVALALLAGVDLVTRLETPVSATFGSKAPGFGTMALVTTSDPAAGAEISATVPAGEAWRVISVVATMVTDATVTNRQAGLVFDDGTTVYAGAFHSSNQAATQTFRYHMATTGIQHASNALGIQLSLPWNVVLLPGHRVRTQTNGLVAGDNWGAAVLYVEKYGAN